MNEQFEYIVRTGSGWTQARLSLLDDTALIEYDSSWMGQQIPVRYILQCEH